MSTSQTVPTKRLAIHTLTAGPERAPTVVLIHGNVSSARFWEPLIDQIDGRFRVVAPDLRGYGATEAAVTDATRGLRDFSDDLHALLEALEVTTPVHLVGWSAGAGVVMQYAIDHPTRVAGLVLESPMSPFGFGGTRADGTPCHADFAGSGGGTANPEFVRLLKAGERGDDGPVAPRNVMNTCYYRAPFRSEAALEERYLDAMLTTRIGDDHYPGDLTTSANWPGIAPGIRGMNNALSPKYCNLAGFAAIDPRPPVLWIRGADDVIVSDTSLFDLGHLGKLGLVPGWPGDEAYPAQPMVAQMRGVLEAYRARGGRYDELVLGECGHSPHIERSAAFTSALHNFLAGT